MFCDLQIGVRDSTDAVPGIFHVISIFLSLYYAFLQAMTFPRYVYILRYCRSAKYGSNVENTWLCWCRCTDDVDANLATGSIIIGCLEPLPLRKA